MDSNYFTTVDFNTQSLKTVDIRIRLSLFVQLLSLITNVAYAKIRDGNSKQAATSPDGEFIYVVGSKKAVFNDKQGNWQMEQTPLGLEII